MTTVSRRAVLLGTVAGAASVTGLGACGPAGSPVGPGAAAVERVERGRRAAGQRAVAARLTAAPSVVDLGGIEVDTWAYHGAVPGPLLRARAGGLLRVEVDNRLPAATSVHWHGVALRNDMDGVPGVTQAPIAPGQRFLYEFTIPDPGTYFFHPHSGVQLDRGLHGVLVVDDPADPGDHDLEWVVVLDDWVDGTGRTPDDVLAELRAGGGAQGMWGMGGMGGMDHGGTRGMGHGGATSPLLGGAGDVTYPHHLVQGRLPSAPATLRGRPGQRVRIRFVNAGSDTAYRVALGGHRLRVTHSDGFPVEPVTSDAVLIAMGERHDVVVTLGDGAFPLVASAEGKEGQGLAVVRTAAGAAPGAGARPDELRGRVVTAADLVAPESARLAPRLVDRHHDLVLAGSMTDYRWTINGATFEEAEPLEVREGERVRVRFRNHSMMFHPMHVHGHTFALVRGGARKDTVVVRSMETVVVDLDAENPGQWATHCHNAYHAKAGMMTTLSYRA